MKTLKRNQKGAMIAGVCTGLADYFDIDVIVFRLLFIFISPSLLLYLVMWLLMEEN